MHNVQLADPDNYWAKQIAKLTGKRKKTEDDRKEISRLEWLGSLYQEEGRIIYPTANVRMCFRDTAKATRRGKDIVRALNPIAQSVPLVFKDDDKTADELWSDEKYRDITLVAVRGRTPRTRPRFNPWMVRVEWLLLPNLLDFDAFKDIAKMAGIIEGLGDNRVNSYGRFDIDIETFDETAL